ncbi:nucleotidyltransferase domain-containing protein [Aeropyrum camini]|uniref:Predicted nucleotidyltransferase n=1 Tax=Aeropyrum camini SY1 = JCM 12091 TaxID=1198449 RepID=U3T812_9CREN|nr:nucleotidyltransferase domain-containing protein [Aeropyrum camini]BAN89632.1 predicted nucleotidyltransferase [Aeropyrum camini SY1 = JCM 12091]
MEVEYSEDHWRLLKEKREKALEIVRALSRTVHPSLIVIHGSVARGDVNPGSDVDVAIVEPVPPGLVEEALAASGLIIYKRVIVMATPRSTPKAYLVLDPSEERVVSLPLARLQPREREFYAWGGEVDPAGLERDVRVPGVTKRLVLILPTPRGHIEEPVVGNEGRVAEVLGISLETVRERVRVLTRRRELGRTGVYLKVEPRPGEPLEETVRRLSASNPFFRRMISGRRG